MVAVLAVIQTQENEFVLVSRKGNDEDYGLVGGKVEGGESHRQALDREVLEETGLKVRDAFILDERVYGDFYTVCYYVTAVSHESDTLEQHIAEFNKNRGDKGLLSLGGSEKLVDPKMSYSDYNEVILDKVIEYLSENKLYRAASAEDIYSFMDELFPSDWGGVKSRITETGVKLTKTPEPWLIGFSDISFTQKSGSTYLESLLKSCLFTAHDCFHNLWGLPYIDDFSDESFDLFKKAQMSGEVAVLCVTEFFLAKELVKSMPELKYIVEKRCAIQMISNGGDLYQITPRDLAGRLDEVIHTGMDQFWVRKSKIASDFFGYYIPMLQKDRENIDANWEIMKKNNFIPNAFPNVRYNVNLTGAELTKWMVEDFLYMKTTDMHIDYELAEFNHKRRRAMKVPSGWYLIKI